MRLFKANLVKLCAILLFVAISIEAAPIATEFQKLVPSDGAVGDLIGDSAFGTAVFVSGDIAVIGAFKDSD